MAMIICSECKKEMSDAAPACPSCGKPVPIIRNRLRGLLLLIGIVFLAGVLGTVTDKKPTPSPQTVAPIASTSQVVDPPKQVAEPTKKEKPILVVSAADLASDYNDNTIAADQKYKGKEYKVSGTVMSIDTDFMGDPYLTLKGGVNSFMEPQFKFEPSEKNQLATLKKGDKVTMVCIGSGDVMKIPMSESCVLE